MLGMSTHPSPATRTLAQRSPRYGPRRKDLALHDSGGVGAAADVPGPWRGGMRPTWAKGDRGGRRVGGAMGARYGDD